MPAECVLFNEQGEPAGYRAVHVVLFNGWSSELTGNAPWPAGGGNPPTNWRISDPPHPFEIKAWRLA